MTATDCYFLCFSKLLIDTSEPEFGSHGDHDGHARAAELYDESDSDSEQSHNAYILSANAKQMVIPVEFGNRQSADQQIADIATPDYNDQSLSDPVMSDELLLSTQQSSNASFVAANNFPESTISPGDLMLLLLKLKHGLTKEATEDVAKLVNIFSGKNTVSTSMHNIYKNFISNHSSVQLHHICVDCGSYIGVVPAGDVCCSFTACGKKLSVDDSLKAGNFFFYWPLRSQIIDLFNNHKLAPFLRKQCTVNNSNCAGRFQDITDGNLYTKCMKSSSNGQHSLSITFNCDGIPVFKSSSFAIWPVFVLRMSCP